MVEGIVVVLLNMKYLQFTEFLSTEALCWKKSNSLDLIWITPWQVRLYTYIFYLYVIKLILTFSFKD